MKISKWIFLFIFIILIGILILYSVTQQSWGFDLGSSNANELGDAIGGILGPYFSFIGSCLVAYTIYLQLESRKKDKKKEYEKVIFDNCLETLKKAEEKIYELNASDPNQKFASIYFIDEYFNCNWTSDSIKVHLFITEINSATNLFNSTSIKNKGYFTIIINEIDTILRLISSSILGKWNLEKRLDHSSPKFFHNTLESYNLVKIFYSNIKDLKTNFANHFDENFQIKELKQLKETCSWLEGFKDDLHEFIGCINGETDLMIMDFGNGPNVPADKKEEYDRLKNRIAEIKEKYGLTKDQNDIFE